MNIIRSLNVKNTIRLLFVILLLVSCRNKSDINSVSNQEPVFPVKSVTAQNVVLEKSFPAIIKGLVDTDVKPRVNGTIQEVYIDEGAVVHKGQKLFKIDSPEVAQELESSKAAYNTALLDVNRVKPLSQKGIIGEVQLQAYENALKVAEAQLNRAKAAISWTIITSPINGTVGEIYFRQGSLVNNNSILTNISEIQSVIAYFSMNEKDLYSFLNETKGNSQSEKINNMTKVGLTLADGSIYEQKGQITTISGIIDKNGAVAFRALFPNKSFLLRSGTSAKITISQLIKNVFLIPQDITFNQQDKVFVYQYDGNKAIQKSIVVKPTPDGKNYAVISGLREGDKIVTDGIAQLSNGMKIQVR
jgi:RND family efflux transporter, MFP subunit